MIRRAAITARRRAHPAKLLTLTLVAISISSVLPSAAVAARNACEAEILRAAERHQVPAGILYAVGLTETGNKGSLHPNALNIEGRAVFASSREAAIREFEQASRAGRKLIDLGCMQINHHYHGQHFNSLNQMLEPRLNVDYAARFLVKLKERHGSWSMAVARYHAGPNNNPAQKKYVCRVISNMVATGFGKWTSEARNFCNH